MLRYLPEKVGLWYQSKSIKPIKVNNYLLMITSKKVQSVVGTLLVLHDKIAVLGWNELKTERVVSNIDERIALLSTYLK